MPVTKEPFGQMPDATPVERYTLSNPSGMQVSILTFGGAVQSLLVPDKNGNFADVVCGYDTLESYLGGDGYQGALVGRYANRIGGASFLLDGKTYPLYQNDGKNHLHGGKVGFSHRVWNAEAVDGEEPSLILTLFSPDGEEGYPGNLSVKVTYHLSCDNRFSIHYEATTDHKTVLNLTNHSYFNLGGFRSGSVLSHVLKLDADSFLETDETLIPTGTILPVADTPFDFRREKELGQDFFEDYEALHIAGGYDHCMVFAKHGEADDNPGGIVPRATLWDPKSGRMLRLLTDQPCMQLYTANFMRNAAYPFKGGYEQKPQNAVCLETQCMPDSMHHDNFTDCTLEPGEVYDRTTIFAFSCRT